MSAPHEPDALSGDPLTGDRKLQQRIEALRRLEGDGKPGRGLQVLAALGLLIIGGALALGGDGVSRLFFGTSDVEDMQKTSRYAGESVDTGMPAPEGLGIETIPAAYSAATDDAAAKTAAELARLKQELETLRRNREPVDLEGLITRQADILQKQFEAQLAAQELFYNRRMEALEARADEGARETAAQKAARERMEADRAKRAEIAERQVSSPALVYDSAGQSAAGAGSGRQGAGGDDRFLAAASARGHQVARAGLITDPARTIVQGTMLEAVLETAISTDLPGAVRGVLTVDVMSFDGWNVLLPRGTSIIGTYNSEIKLTQGRALLAWNRAITPAGVTIELGGYGTDTIGMSGQPGKVNSHFGARFGSAALISLISAAPLIAADQSSDISGEVAQDISEDLRYTTSDVMQEYLRIPPTINVDQGSEIRVFVNRDLVF